MRVNRPPLWTLASAAALALGQVFRVSPLKDAASGAPLDGWRFEPTWAHLLTTPLSMASDWAACMSLRQLIALLAWLLASWWLLRPFRRLPWRGLRREAAGYALHVAGVIAFVAWTVLPPRPMARLTRPPGAKDMLVADLHSHTSFSWDGRKSFTPERNLAWHRDAGYDATFITDHNRVEGSRLAFEASLLAWRATGVKALRGEELSLHDAHVVALGARERIDPDRYRGPDGLLRFLAEAGPKHGALAVLSLPEYWRHHRDRLDSLASAGAAGFELANGAPKAADIPPSGRRRVVELCRARNLFLAAVSDNHGWAASACAWSLIRLPGHAAMEPEALERAVLARLGTGFDAATAAERPLHRPEGRLGLVLDPVVNLWTLLRVLSPAQALVCFLYIAGAAVASRFFSRPSPT